MLIVLMHIRNFLKIRTSRLIFCSDTDREYAAVLKRSD